MASAAGGSAVVYSLFIVAPIVCWSSVFAVLCVLSYFESSLGGREVVALTQDVVF